MYNEISKLEQIVNKLTASLKQKKLVELLTSYVSVYCQKTTNKLIRYSEVCERGADGCGSGQKLLNKLT